MAVMSSAHVVTKVVVSCRTMLGVDIDVDEIHNKSALLVVPVFLFWYGTWMYRAITFECM